jgi:hypothetical protein
MHKWEFSCHISNLRRPEAERFLQLSDGFREHLKLAFVILRQILSRRNRQVVRNGAAFIKKRAATVMTLACLASKSTPQKAKARLFSAPSTGVFFFLTLYFQNNKSTQSRWTFFKIYFRFHRNHLQKFRSPDPLDRIFHRSRRSSPSDPRRA